MSGITLPTLPARIPGLGKKILFEVKSRKRLKFYQTVITFPNFMSMVIVGYVAYAVLSPQAGIMNSFLKFHEFNMVAADPDDRESVEGRRHGIHDVLCCIDGN